MLFNSFTPLGGTRLQDCWYVYFNIYNFCRVLNIVQEEGSIPEFRKIASSLKIFFRNSLEKSARSPVDLVAYQHIIWILDADISQQTGLELSSLVHSMWLSFYSRSWKNTYNIASKIARLDHLDPNNRVCSIVRFKGETLTTI